MGTPTVTTASPSTYPWNTELNDLTVCFRWMTAEDRDAMLAFTHELPERDLLFLRTDITQPEVVDTWIGRLRSGKEVTLLAEEVQAMAAVREPANPASAANQGQIIGFCSLHLSQILWTRHLGEIYLLVSSKYRGKGVGGQLARQIFDRAPSYHLHKLVAQMMSTQRTSQSLFHHLGFIPEAMLHDWVIDRNGRTHDLIVMSREVDEEVPES